ncbi:NADH:ubiquinone oxidoreductase subunit NDUFA12 [Oceanibaculum pacificum]|uniref:NADH dehydrogenase n=1 Tax=Oceanibaculum pacificum TaxID=580166 RepID=A0A154VAP5_9PROT|nr:NADH:ubiquinone oxidoreductase subunit NDUFA12 [Oceanibaculum pacificum]KZC98339.1 NADH dehydrogenase [Oceanibaculum pacificum]
MADIGTRFFTWLNGEKVGEDQFGNLYYVAKKRASDKAAGQREKRWVVYKGEPEASKVPPAWHAWLHHTIKDLPGEADLRAQPWQKEHQPNLTGTELAYRPPGHVLKGGKRDRATGDYQAWRPE